MSLTSPKADLDPIFVSVREAARMLGVSTWFVNTQLIHATTPLIDSRMMGGRRLIVLASLRQYAEGLPRTAS